MDNDDVVDGAVGDYLDDSDDFNDGDLFCVGFSRPHQQSRWFPRRRHLLRKNIYDADGIEDIDGLQRIVDIDDCDVPTSQLSRKNIIDVDGLQRIDDTDNGDDDDVPTSQLPRRRNASPEVVCPAKPPQA